MAQYALPTAKVITDGYTVDLTQNLIVDGYIYAGNGLSVLGGNTILSGNTFVDGYLDCIGPTTFFDHITVDGYKIDLSAKFGGPQVNDTLQFNGTSFIPATVSGGGAVNSVANSDGSLTISPTTGSVLASLNTAHSNIFTATQTITQNLIVDGYIYAGNGLNVLGGNTFIDGYFDVINNANFFDGLTVQSGATTLRGNVFVDGYLDALNEARFFDHITVDGYKIDLSAKFGGPQVNDTLQFNGTSFIPTTSTSSTGAASNALFYSPVQHANVWGMTVHAGNETNGCMFIFTNTCTVTGANFVYPDSSSRTVKVSLWDPSGVVVASDTHTYNSAGIKNITWSSTVAITASNLYKKYVLGVYHTGGTAYWTIATQFPWIQPSNTATPFATCGGPSLYWLALDAWSSGDAIPNNVSTDWQGVEPTFTVP